MPTGYIVRGKTYGFDGKLLFPGTLRFRESKYEQASPDVAPVLNVYLDAVAYDGNDNRIDWKIRIPVDDYWKLDKTLPKYVPKGLDFEDTKGALLRVIEAQLDDVDSVPVHNKDYWSDDTGSYLRGRQLTNVPNLTIVNEHSEPGAGTVYRLRSKSEDGTTRYALASFWQLQTGQWASALKAGGKAFDSLSLFGKLREEWGGRSEFEKRNFCVEEIRDKQAALEKQAQLILNGR